MAVLFSNVLHSCPKCGKVEFEEVTIKTYNQTNESVIKTNNAKNCIRCISCGTLESVGEFGQVQIEE